MDAHKYIQPGLGDAGDKLIGEEEIIDLKKLDEISTNITKHREGLNEVINSYALQLTGSTLSNYETE